MPKLILFLLLLVNLVLIQIFQNQLVEQHLAELAQSVADFLHAPARDAHLGAVHQPNAAVTIGRFVLHIGQVDDRRFVDAQE